MKRKQIYTVSEFMAYTSEDMKITDKFIGYLKRNKKVYMQLAYLVGVFLFINSLNFGITEIHISNMIMALCFLVEIIIQVINGKLEIPKTFISYIALIITINLTLVV